ncbi:hypothetical protein JZU46_04695 [bacterium]|nr:hypothetical protein [bacterium]
MAHKFKLTGITPSIYGSYDGMWAFAYRTETGFAMLHNPMHCKDFSHEILANIIHESSIFSGGTTLNTKIVPEAVYGLRLVLFFKLKDAKESKKYLFSVKKYINVIEKGCGIKQTLITEVDTDKSLKDCQAFVLTFPKVYIESPALFHAMVAFMRTLKSIDFEVTEKNIGTILESPKFGQDTNILKFITKHNVFKLIMANHNDIFKDRTLKDIYPTKVDNPKGTGYHSGFGMVSVCQRVLSSKAYAERIDALLTKHNIPQFESRTQY